MRKKRYLIGRPIPEQYEARIRQSAVKDFACRVLLAYTKNYMQFQENVLALLEDYEVKS